jgi:hypothetical protein
VTIGNAKDTKKTIFGTQAEAIIYNGTNLLVNGVMPSADNNYGITKNGDGLARSVGYCSPVATGSLAFKLASNFKVTAELHVSSSDKVYLNEVKSEVADVSFTLAARGSDASSPAAGARIGVTSTDGGRNDLFVEPKTEFVTKVEYLFGEEGQGATLGLAVARSADEFTYTADTLAPYTAIPGVEQSTGGTMATEDFSAASSATYYLNPTGVVVSEKYDEPGLWVGVVASAASRINDRSTLRVAASYYKRNFGASTSGSNGVKFLVSDTESNMIMLNVSVASV